MSVTRQMRRATFGPEAFEGLGGKLPTQYPRTIGPNAMKYLQEVVDSGLTRKSTMVERFERAFAEELGVKHCIATPGCNPALSALAAAFSFQPGDEIIVSSITDYGSIQGLIKENYIPVFADTEPGHVNINAESIERCITDRTRAILCVHKTGIVCDMDPINELARKHGLIVYEDVCQAIFSQYKGRLAGTLGLAAGFSFDSEKTMGSDLGGCLVTDDDELAERIRFVGQSRGGVIEPGFGRKHVVAGYAFRMPFCTAAIVFGPVGDHPPAGGPARPDGPAPVAIGRRDSRHQAAADSRLSRRLLGLDVQLQHRSGPVPLHGGGVRQAACRGGDSRGGHGQVLLDAGGRHVPRRERPAEGLSLLDAAGFEGVSLRRRDLPERLEVRADLDSLVDVLREVYREAL